MRGSEVAEGGAMCAGPLCGQVIPRRRQHGQWQRYCSLSCANRARFGKIAQVMADYDLRDDAALRRWLIDRLNRSTIEATAQLCGVQKQAVYHWMAVLGIRRVVRYE